MIDRDAFEQRAAKFFDSSEEGFVSGRAPGNAMFDRPVFGYAAADDPMFEMLRNSDILGGHYQSPDSTSEERTAASDAANAWSVYRAKAAYRRLRNNLCRFVGHRLL